MYETPECVCWQILAKTQVISPGTCVSIQFPHMLQSPSFNTIYLSYIYICIQKNQKPKKNDSPTVRRYFKSSRQTSLRSSFHPGFLSLFALLGPVANIPFFFFCSFLHPLLCGTMTKWTTFQSVKSDTAGRDHQSLQTQISFVRPTRYLVCCSKPSTGSQFPWIPSTITMILPFASCGNWSAQERQ